MIYLREDFKKAWAGRDPFDCARELTGQVYRAKEGRRTLQFSLNGQSFFLKLHEGVGWGEIIKNLTQLRLPILGARHEYEACLRLKELGVDTMTPVAYGVRGVNPAKQLSFLVTEDLIDTESLEDYCARFREQPPSIKEKRALIKKVARAARLLHDNGLNHRDFYLCHFLKPRAATPFQFNDPLYLIDLHRCQQRAITPWRWRAKDIAGLFYSAFDVPLTQRDVLCFLREYKPAWLRAGGAQKRDIATKASKLYLKDFKREPPVAIQQLLARIS